VGVLGGAGREGKVYQQPLGPGPGSWSYEQVIIREGQSQRRSKRTYVLLSNKRIYVLFRIKVKDSQSQIVKDSQSQLTKNNENMRLADCTKKDEKIMSFLCILLYFKKRPKTWTKNNKKA